MNIYNYTLYQLQKDGHYGKKMGEGSIAAESKEDAADKLQAVSDAMKERHILIVKSADENKGMR